MMGRWSVVLALCACSSKPAASDPEPAPIEISIVYGSEKARWLDEQLQQFNRSQRAIHATGVPMGSGEAMSAILDGKEQPVVFSPASSAYIALLNQRWQRAHPTPIAPAG